MLFRSSAFQCDSLISLGSIQPIGPRPQNAFACSPVKASFTSSSALVVMGDRHAGARLHGHLEQVEAAPGLLLACAGTAAPAPRTRSAPPRPPSPIHAPASDHAAHPRASRPILSPRRHNRAAITARPRCARAPGSPRHLLHHPPICPKIANAGLTRLWIIILSMLSSATPLNRRTTRHARRRPRLPGSPACRAPALAVHPPRRNAAPRRPKARRAPP